MSDVGKVFSTFFDPLGLGVGKLMTGQDSALLNVDQAYGNKVGDKKNKPNQPGSPTEPSFDTAGATAEAQQTEARRALLLSGGETSLTGPGGAPILGGMTSSKTLLGV